MTLGFKERSRTSLDRPADDPPKTATPLCVDLDGTLVRTDTLIELWLNALRLSPFAAIRCIGWLLIGKARFKAELASMAHIDPAHLPYNEKFIEFLHQQKSEGRHLALATASYESVAKARTRIWMLR